jgi:FkbM family methyltransferase
MLIPLDTLFSKYNIQLNGILHVGAHECEELSVYEKHLDRSQILWVEAIPAKVALCKSRYPGLLIENAIVSDTIETIRFNVANNGQSSSFLDLGLHAKFHPEIHYVESFNHSTSLLKDILPNYDIVFNFINLDIQGAELRALKGMESYLPLIDYIYTEVNEDYVYTNCNLVTELDEYLAKFGFHRVETIWYGDCKWGDAFYIRDK